MGLVAYSDSEDSETDKPDVPAPKPILKPITSSTSGPRKIKVDLPAPITEREDAHRPGKIRRLGTGFGSFNDFLPAPKQPPKAPGGGAISAASKGLKPGFSLKTSSEAAFSRAPADNTVGHIEDPFSHAESDFDAIPPTISAAPTPHLDSTAPASTPAMKPNPLKFKPLSVTNKKKTKKFGSIHASSVNSATLASSNIKAPPPVPSPPKSKTSLFGLAAPSAGLDAKTLQADTEMGEYQPLLTEQDPITRNDTSHQDASHYHDSQHAIPQDPLSALATEMNLTPSQRRQLMGRHAGSSLPAGTATNVHHFDTSKEYSHNETLRQAGELTQHREVKGIGAGRHSLQQLISSATSQKEALEDKWAAGRRKQADGGAAYGFR